MRRASGSRACRDVLSLVRPESVNNARNGLMVLNFSLNTRHLAKNEGHLLGHSEFGQGHGESEPAWATQARLGFGEGLTPTPGPRTPGGRLKPVEACLLP